MKVWATKPQRKLATGRQCIRQAKCMGYIVSKNRKTVSAHFAAGNSIFLVAPPVSLSSPQEKDNQRNW